MGNQATGLGVVGVLAGIVLVALTFGGCGSSTGPSPEQSTLNEDAGGRLAPEQQAQQGALEQGTIHVDRWIPSATDDLAKASSLIVVGTVIEASEPEQRPIGGLDAPEDLRVGKVERDYTVRVERVLKGDGPSTIVVVQVLSTFVDRTESAFPDLLPLTVGDRYVLFLREGAPTGVWVAVGEPYRYRLAGGDAILEVGSTAAAALAGRLQQVFPSVDELGLLNRIKAVALAFPEAVSIGLLQGSPAAAVDLPQPGDRLNLTVSLALTTPTALAIEDGFSFKWAGEAGEVRDPGLLGRLATSLDTLLTVEAGTGELPPAGTFPTLIFSLTRPVLGVSTVGFTYDPSQGLLMYSQELQLRMPAEAKAVLDEALGIQ